MTRSAPWSNHVILTLGRSGSNTLADMLNQHPALLNYGEVLGEWNKLRRLQRRLRLFRDDDAAYLDALIARPAVLRAINTSRSMAKRLRGKSNEIKRLGDLKSVGFKDFTINFQRYGLMDYLPARAAQGRMKVIGLTRANVLARMISNEMLVASGVTSTNEAARGGKRPKLRLDPAQVVGKLDQIAAENRALSDMLDALPDEAVLRLDYEDLYSSPERTADTMRRAYDFLGVPRIEPRTRMGKLSSRNPLDALENPDEISEAIRASDYAEYLSV